MKNRTKKRISIAAIMLTAVFCIVVFVLCFLDVKSKKQTEIAENSFAAEPCETEIAYACDNVDLFESEPTVERVEPAPAKASTAGKNKITPKTPTAEIESRADIATPPVDENISVEEYDEIHFEELINNEATETDKDTEDYDTTEIDKKFSFSLHNNSTEYKVNAKNRDITEAIIPAMYRGLPVTELADNAFGNCNELKKVVLPYGLKRIGNNAFVRCENLQRLCVPATVVWIGNNAFAKCSSLMELILPNNIEINSTVLRP